MEGVSTLSGKNDAPDAGVSSSLIVAGVVLANPSAGSVFAIIPALNAYTDIKVESIRSIETNAPLLSEPEVFGGETALSADNVTAVLAVNHPASTHDSDAPAPGGDNFSMASLLSIDLRDLPVIVGGACFAGSVAGVVWSLLASGSAPSLITIGAALIGSFAGRAVLRKSEKNR